MPEWQHAICQQVRELVHAADPQVAETIKRTRQPYFVLDGNICALLAANDRRYGGSFCAQELLWWATLDSNQ